MQFASIVPCCVALVVFFFLGQAYCPAVMTGISYQSDGGGGETFIISVADYNDDGQEHSLTPSSSSSFLLFDDFFLSGGGELGTDSSAEALLTRIGNAP